MTLVIHCIIVYNDYIRRKDMKSVKMPTTPKPKMPKVHPTQMAMMLAMYESQAKENAKYERRRPFLYAPQPERN